MAAQAGSFVPSSCHLLKALITCLYGGQVSEALPRPIVAIKPNKTFKELSLPMDKQEARMRALHRLLKALANSEGRRIKRLRKNIAKLLFHIQNPEFKQQPAGGYSGCCHRRKSRPTCPDAALPNVERSRSVVNPIKAQISSVFTSLPPFCT